jgi:hypothetical protein
MHIRAARRTRWARPMGSYLVVNSSGDCGQLHGNLEEYVNLRVLGSV